MGVSSTLQQFEEIWLGHRPLQTQLQWKNYSSEPIESSSNNEREEFSSPLPMLEDSCVLNLEAFVMSSAASDKYQRTNMLSRDLFNDCTDHQKSQIQTTGNLSPFNELTSSVCSDDAWNLLEEFEAISDIDNIITLPSPQPLPTMSANYSTDNNNTAITMLEMENIDTLKLETVFDAFPDLPQLDELIKLTSSESSSLDSSVLTDTTFQCGYDAGNNTTDILAHLITDTILSDSELEGLFSNTMLDFNTVLGQTYFADTDLVNVDQPMQEVPQVLIADSPKRPLESVDDQFKLDEDSTSSSQQSKKRKVGSVSPSSSACPSPSLSSDCNDEQLHNVKYMLMRQKNNEASKKSRSMRKQKHRTMEQEVSHLEEENKRLRDKAEQLEKTVTTLKTSLMKHILDLKNQK